MRFKFFIFFSLLVPTFGFPQENPHAHTLGVVFRPTFFKHFLEAFNQQNQSIEINECLDEDWNISLVGRVSADISLPSFTPKSRSLALETQILNLNFDGMIYQGCGSSQSRPLTSPFSINLDCANLKFFVAPEDLSLKVEKEELGSISKNLKLDIHKFPKISTILNTIPWQESVVTTIVKKIENRFSDQIHDKLRGLIFLQSIYDATADSAIWKEGPILQRGALTLEFAPGSKEQRDILFGFVPFSKNSLTVSPMGVEFYVNALFLNHDHLKSMAEIAPLRMDKMASRLDITKSALQTAPSWLPSNYSPVSVPQESESEISTILPASLINEAFNTVYKARLLGFVAKNNLAEQTKNLVVKDAPSVYQIIKMNPKAAPKIYFKPDRLQLEVKGYSLEVGTFIEDRMIPSTQVNADAKVSVTLKIDNKTQMLNIVLLPETFEVTLKDLKNRLGEKEIEIFTKVAEGLWGDFIKSNPELALFPTVIESETAPIEISKITVQGDNLLLDMNVDWKKSKL
ncbi:MAG: hypothetical protein J0L93_08810 [Deltaproteobacteria bacterium]|nr:hypothetical protein [Deltaproteobacteria bacterium]